MDYTRARWAPVVNCVVKYRDRILLVRRSRALNLYPAYWNGIGGFLDDKKSLQEKVREELREELGIPRQKIRVIRLGTIFHQEGRRYGKTWIVHPVLVEVTTGRVRLDWEAEDYRWVRPHEVRKFKLAPGFYRVLKTIFPDRRK